MTANEVDEQIACWRDKQRLIDENLRSFVELPAYSRLFTSSGQPRRSFAGKTESRLASVMDVLRALHEQLATLGKTIDGAEELRSSLSRLMPSRQTLDEIREILCGQSIQLASLPTPAQRRELLRDVTEVVQVSPDELLKMMLDSFRFVRDEVLAVDTADQGIADAVELQRAEFTRLQALAASAKGVASTELAEAGRLLAGLESLAKSDPLAAQTQSASLSASLAAAAASLEEAMRRRRDLDVRMADANALLTQLREMHERASEARAERELKVQSSRGQSAPASGAYRELAELEAWIMRLRQVIENGEHGSADVGLRHWNNSAMAFLSTSRSALEDDEAALRARRDLRGLFDALQAKACQSGRAGEPELAALTQEIRRLFQTRPTPMAQTQELVARFQERLL